jgi:glycosyltransferase involved in cell wall biosynthesis
MNPIVSVVIPLFNQGQFLVETFDSVIQSTFKEIEIIIVDD